MADDLTRLTVRYFGAAGAAAGTPQEKVALEAPANVDSLAALVGSGRPELARVLTRCSYLCDGIAVRDRGKPLVDGSTVDVLPPFAGG